MELMHSMSEKIVDCPRCNTKNSLEKQISIPRINTTAQVSRSVGAAVKQAISEYKERVSVEKGVWDGFDVEALIEESKK